MKRRLDGVGLTRRGVLLGLGALGMAGSMSARAAAPTNADRFVRMRGSPDGKPVMWVYRGVLLVKLAGQLARPLVGVGGVSVTRAVPRAEGIYDGSSTRLATIATCEQEMCWRLSKIRSMVQSCGRLTTARRCTLLTRVPTCCLATLCPREPSFGVSSRDWPTSPAWRR